MIDIEDACKRGAFDIGRAERMNPLFVSAEPYPHVVLDDFFPPSIAEEIWSRRPSIKEQNRAVSVRGNQLEKYGQQRTEGSGDIFDFWASKQCTDFLVRLTGIEGLLADPHLLGSGFHSILPGGKLNIHVDFRRHRREGWLRKLNVLYYLNKGWEDAWGGHLEIWDRERCHRMISPHFNRAVIFETGTESWHGHPNEVRCPEGRTRDAMGLYFYLGGECGLGRAGHKTNWRPTAPVTDLKPT